MRHVFNYTPALFSHKHNCLNQEDLGHSFAFSQNETKVQNAAPLKTGLCSIHNAVVF